MAFQLVELKATARPRAGKGAARQTRREGKIPAVIYGDKKPPQPIAVDHHDLMRLVQKGHFASTVVEVNLDGDKQKVIPRDLQVHPVRDTPIHVDLLRISADGIIRAAIPVRFINEGKSPGLKRGGVLNIVRHDIEVFCPYDKMPSHFEIDLANLNIGTSIHISDINLPEDVKPTIQDRDFTVATIVGRGAEKAEEEAEDAAEEAAEAEAKEKDAKEKAAPADGEDKK